MISAFGVDHVISKEYWHGTGPKGEREPTAPDGGKKLHRGLKVGNGWKNYGPGVYTSAWNEANAYARSAGNASHQKKGRMVAVSDQNNKNNFRVGVTGGIESDTNHHVFPKGVRPSHIQNMNTKKRPQPWKHAVDSPLDIPGVLDNIKRSRAKRERVLAENRAKNRRKTGQPGKVKKLPDIPLTGGFHPNNVRVSNSVPKSGEAPSLRKIPLKAKLRMLLKK